MCKNLSRFSAIFEPIYCFSVVLLWPGNLLLFACSGVQRHFWCWNDLLAIAVGLAVVVGREAKVLADVFPEEGEVIKAHLTGYFLDTQVAVEQ